LPGPGDRLASSHVHAPGACGLVARAWTWTDRRRTVHGVPAFHGVACTLGLGAGHALSLALASAIAPQTAQG